MSMSRRDWTLWAVATLTTVPASLFVWLIGGMGMCGEETYDTPPGSVGDSLCSALVEPVVPWMLLALIPTVLTAVSSFGAVRRRDLGVVWMLIGGAYLLAFLMALAFLAEF
jgi:hypothetical protein